ncbi:hypothetical protein TRICI_001219 [Trichomonascus ciferrii]|uniref:Major facilitator superfamily (MFS) profile domain-containing protein n=1 Tax=Trichomonascus ciferrii TaxID=44093 RepID=A0A642V9Y3_9ASCO|nr:hypothetical protein TRICI_001219 [Trichomonascus ciferrii]
MNWKTEIGIRALGEAHYDVYILMAQRVLRMAAYGITTLILALFFEQLGVSEAGIGYFMTLTLIGDVVLSYIVTFYADMMGRRHVLMWSCLAMAVSGAIFAISSNYWILLAAAVIGVISPSGDETGPFKSVEESTLAHLTTYDDRSDIFAWYGVMGTAGSALGSLGGGFVIDYLQNHMTKLEAYRWVFWIYTILSVLKFLLNCCLSSKCEENNTADDEREALIQRRHSEGEEDNHKTYGGLSKETLKTVTKLCILFGIDSIGGGFMPNSWVVVYFSRKFGIAERELGSILFSTTLVGSFSVILSSSVYKRCGPIWAMVLTHLPAAIAQILIPIPGQLPPAIVFLLIRAATTVMDVVPRQVFLASVVKPDERTKVMGIVNVVKTLARSIGPTFTGHLAQVGLLWLAFVIGGGLETVHDFGLLAFFSHLRHVR